MLLLEAIIEKNGTHQPREPDLYFVMSKAHFIAILAFKEKKFVFVFVLYIRHVQDREKIEVVCVYIYHSECSFGLLSTLCS